MQKPIILCIDDYPSSLLCLKWLRRAEEYEVLVASSGSAGLILHSSRPTDAVILDYEMPQMSGGCVATHMKLAKPEIPIVLRSGHDWLPEDVLQTVDALVPKGEPVTTLLATINELLVPSKAPSSL